ncbi:MAG: hypothetical protein LC114_24270 [Bryobacterales bacterium]|nr:hypothetical protein [Bryobacterales bacterium]
MISGCRCPEHNSLVSGAQNSQHLCGAADIQAAHISPDRVAHLAKNVPPFAGGHWVLRHLHPCGHAPRQSSMRPLDEEVPARLARVKELAQRKGLGSIEVVMTAGSAAAKPRHPAPCDQPGIAASGRLRKVSFLPAPTGSQCWR